MVCRALPFESCCLSLCYSSYHAGYNMIKSVYLQWQASRRQKREDAEETSSKTAKKLLSNILKHQALSTVLGTAPTSGEGSGDSHQGIDISQTTKPREPDIFELKPLPEADRPL